MNDLQDYVNMEKESSACPGHVQLDSSNQDGKQTTAVTLRNGAPSLPGGRPTMDGTATNDNTDFQARKYSNLDMRVSPITCSKEPEKENASLDDDNRYESSLSSHNSGETPLASSFSWAPFSLPPGYAMHHSLLHEIGIAPSNGQLVQDGQTEPWSRPGLHPRAVEQTKDSSLRVMPTHLAKKTSKSKSKTKTKANAPINGKIIPTDLDVLCGRGPTVCGHPGNGVFHRIKDELQEEYFATSGKSKAVIAQNLVDQIHGRGGRFLKNDGSRWMVVSHKYARDKASQALRTVSLTKAERSARRIFFKTEKDMDSKKRRFSDLTKEEIAARALFEKVRDRQDAMKGNHKR